jgi:hypothetical protein
MLSLVKFQALEDSMCDPKWQRNQLAIAHVSPEGSICWIQKMPPKLAWELAGFQALLNAPVKPDEPERMIEVVPAWCVPTMTWTCGADRDIQSYGN